MVYRRDVADFLDSIASFYGHKVAFVACSPQTDATVRIKVFDARAGCHVNVFSLPDGLNDEARAAIREWFEPIASGRFAKSVA